MKAIQYRSSDLEATLFRKRFILGSIKNIEDKLMESLIKSEDLLKQKDRHYQVEELEEKLKQSAAVNKSNIELMAKKKALEVKLQEVNNILIYAHACHAFNNSFKN